MKSSLILLPVFAMVLLTFGIGIWMIKLRFKAVREDGLNPGYFQLNRGAKLPDYLAKVSNHYANLFEMPVLFYFACLILYIEGTTGMFEMILAWVFVLFRYLHAFIHTTHNNLKHRRLAFLGGTTTLAVLWFWILIKILSNSL